MPSTLVRCSSMLLRPLSKLRRPPRGFWKAKSTLFRWDIVIVCVQVYVRVCVLWVQLGMRGRASAAVRKLLGPGRLEMQIVIQDRTILVGPREEERLTLTEITGCEGMVVVEGSNELLRVLGIATWGKG